MSLTKALTSLAVSLMISSAWGVSLDAPRYKQEHATFEDLESIRAAPEGHGGLNTLENDGWGFLKRYVRAEISSDEDDQDLAQLDDIESYDDLAQLEAIKPTYGELEKMIEANLEALANSNKTVTGYFRPPAEGHITKKVGGP